MKLRIIAGLLFVLFITAGMGTSSQAAPWRCRPHAGFYVRPVVRVYTPPIVVGGYYGGYHHRHHCAPRYHGRGCYHGGGRRYYYR